MRADPEQRNYSDMPTASLSAPDVWLMEKERHRLARELHDGPLQALTAISIRIEVCKRLLRNNDLPALQDELAQLKLEFEKSINDFRDLMAEWRLPSLNADNLPEVIDGYVHEYEGHTGIEVSLDLRELSDSLLHREQKVAIFRILQEALRNASQHSGATQVRIESMVKKASLRISIEDNGEGFNLLSATASYPRQGLGLAGMQERAKALDGELQIDSQPGRGTNITLIVPLLASDR